MKCLAIALSHVLQRDALPGFEKIGSAPWCGADLIYVAFEMGIHLVTFPESHFGTFDCYYLEYDGILCGDLSDGRQHAYAKRDGQLIDTDGQMFDVYSDVFHDMKNRVFAAWVNKPG